MKFLVLLSAVSVALAAPAPQDDAPVALSYVHDPTGDTAEAYVHEEIAAEPYVHDEPLETHAIAAEAYIHEEPAVAAAAPVAPVVYAGYPYAGYPYVVPAAAPAVKAAEVPAATAPLAYAAYPYAFPYAAYHTGCLNSVGSVVPCAQ